MILLNFFFSLIQNIVISITIKKIFNIESTIKIIITTIVSTLYMTLIKNFDVSIFLLALFPIFIYTLILTFDFKDFHFSYFAFPAILMSLLLSADSVGYIITSYINEISYINFKPNGEFSYTYSLTSTLLFSLLCVGFYYLTHKNRDDIKIKNSIALGTAMFVLILMFSNLLKSILFTNFSIYTIYTLLIEFMILTLLIFYLYSSMHKQAKENLEINNKLIRVQYQNQMYSLVNQLNNQLMQDKHMIIYNYLKIKHMLNDKEHDLQEFIDREIERLSKYKYISSTGNLLFDYMMTTKINTLRSDNIDIKTVFLLNKDNTLLNDESLITVFIDCIDIALESKSDKIQIFIEEKNNYIIFKLITSKNIPTDKIKQHSKIKRISYKNEDNYKEISLLIS